MAENPGISRSLAPELLPVAEAPSAGAPPRIADHPAVKSFALRFLAPVLVVLAGLAITLSIAGLLGGGAAPNDMQADAVLAPRQATAAAPPARPTIVPAPRAAGARPTQPRAAVRARAHRSPATHGGVAAAQAPGSHAPSAPIKAAAPLRSPAPPSPPAPARAPAPRPAPAPAPAPRPAPAATPVRPPTERRAPASTPVPASQTKPSAPSGLPGRQ